MLEIILMGRLVAGTPVTERNRLRMNESRKKDKRLHNITSPAATSQLTIPTSPVTISNLYCSIVSYRFLYITVNLRLS